MLFVRAKVGTCVLIGWPLAIGGGVGSTVDATMLVGCGKGATGALGFTVGVLVGGGGGVAVAEVHPAKVILYRPRSQT